MNWINNKQWRKKTVDSKIMIMRDHNWAFAAWEIALLDGAVKAGATLVHVDSHLDDVFELADEDRFYNPIASYEEALLLAKPVELKDVDDDKDDQIGMRIDNFIWPSLMRDTIDSLIHVSDHSQQEATIKNVQYCSEFGIRIEDRLDDPNEYISKKAYARIKGKDKKIERVFSIEEFIEKIPDLELVSPGKSLILDLDLDYFNDSNTWNYDPLLKDEVTIKNNLIALKENYDWDFITVALSPEFCGGEEPCNYILDIFYDVFNINKETLIDW